MSIDMIQKMSEITDPDELMEFLSDSVSSYKKSKKPQTRLGYGALYLIWSLVFYLTTAGATYLWNLLVVTGVLK